MTFINPISGAALPAAQAQERAAADKVRQVRQQQVDRRVVAASAADRFDHVVENAEAVSGARDEGSRDGRRPPPRRRRPAKDTPQEHDGEPPPPHIDVRG